MSKKRFLGPLRRPPRRIVFRERDLVRIGQPSGERLPSDPTAGDAPRFAAENSTKDRALRRVAILECWGARAHQARAVVDGLVSSAAPLPAQPLASKFSLRALGGMLSRAKIGGSRFAEELVGGLPTAGVTSRGAWGLLSSSLSCR